MLCESMKRKKIIKIFSIIFLFLIVFNLSPTYTYAKTSTYTGDNEIVDPDLDDTNTVSGWIVNGILGAIGKAIFAIGWCIEKIATAVVKLLTNINQFPWSDYVIFNSVPLLDPNFINPSEGSLFMDTNGAYTTVGEAVRNVYFTGLSIGLGFFGIIVAVMAIRLAISSIASEKAKYKEAIVTWLTALVLLFALHYILSFVFYINEQLVEVACQIVNSQISSASDAKTINGLGIYFKEQAATEADWGTDSFVASIVYCVFIIQSIMFFYSYIKRLFFVVVLAVIAPFVVIYDFMKKAVS